MKKKNWFCILAADTLDARVIFKAKGWSDDFSVAVLQKIYKQFCLDLYKLIFCLFSSDTLNLLMFVCPAVSES